MVKKISTYSFTYDCEVEYDIHTNCKRYSCDYICRCGVIENARITCAPNTCDFVIKYYGECDILTQYCIDRILTHLGFWDRDNFSVQTCRGHYGEEIKNVTFDNAARADIMINEIEGMSNKDKILYILKIEYGHVPDHIVSEFGDTRIEVVPRTNVSSFANVQQMVKMDQHVINYYNEYSLPLCVVRGREDKYVIIDGNHRFEASNKKKIMVVVV